MHLRMIVGLLVADSKTCLLTICSALLLILPTVYTRSFDSFTRLKNLSTPVLLVSSRTDYDLLVDPPRIFG